MKWPLFENKIGKELSEHRSEVDVDALWSAIEPEVDRINTSRKKKRRGFFWLWLLGAALLGSGMGYYFLNDTNATDTPITAEITTSKKPAVEKNTEITEASLSTATTENEGNETSIVNSETPETNDINTSRNSEPQPSIQNPITQTNITSLNQVTSVAKESPILPERTDSEVAAEKEATSILVKSDENNRFFIDPIDVLQLDDLVYTGIPPVLNFSESALTTEHKDASQPDEVVDKRHPASKKQFRFSGSLRGGIGYADRKLETLESTGDNYLKLRESTEKMLETVSAGLLLNARHQSGFEFSTGFNYTRITELFEIQNTTVNIDSIPGVLFYGVNPNNDTIPVYGMVPHKVTVEQHKKYYNRYTLLDVPVLVGYHFENGDWSIGAEAGVFANLSLKTSGKFMTDLENDSDIEPLFKSKIGLSYYFGFSASYKLGDSFELSLSPFVRHFPKNFAQSGYTLSQTYTLYGIQAGARYWF